MDNRQAEANIDSGGFDWTNGTQTDAVSGDEYEGYEIGEGATAPTATAEEIERESGFKSIPPMANCQLIVIGFLIPKDSKDGPITRKHKDCYFGERHESYESATVAVKLAAIPGQIAVDPATGDDIMLDNSYQVLERLTLPPSDPHGIKCYMEATSKPGGKPGTAGFDAKKTFQFLERLGFVWPRGGKLPEEARKLKNWVGKKIVANIQAGTPYTKDVFDPATGMKEPKTFPGNNQVELFSYRPHPDTIKQYQRAGEIVAKEQGQSSTPPNAAPPSGQQTAPRKPSGGGPKKPQPAGIDNV